ncbi:MAG TPA: EAL domain-containing protein [Burkholderiales bacterium]|nr:EAL domain-containing protein [Burkholderiales bacterium]
MERMLRALIVEDSEDDALLLINQLSQAYELRWRRVDTEEGLALALLDEWDIIFADYSMPRFSGSRALAQVRQRGIEIPFIFVSGTIGEDTAVIAMKEGAQDYIMKDNLKRLLPAVERELRETRAHREQRRVELELRLLETTTRSASEAGDALSALAVTLAGICENTGWFSAQSWIPSADGKTIECSSAWFCRDGALEKFRTDSLNHPLAPGQDLPGQAWSSRQSIWVRDVTKHENFRRTKLAAEAGLRTGLAIPVMIGDEVIAVLEFFTREVSDKDPRVLQILAAVVTQLSGIVQRKRAEERLHYLAHYDDLTGLPNRVLFTDRLKQAMFEANRHTRLVGVAFLDLDRFKTINDSLGHGVGDMLLKGVAERLNRCVREGDTVARLAGDEFTMVLADMAHVDHASQVARKVLDSLSRPFHIAGHELFTSASLGMTLYPFDDDAVEGLLRNADVAMYRAKDQGGNSYQFYSADMTAKAHERLSLENDMRRALERDEFFLEYQPIVALRDKAVVALEALVRWRHPQRGLISPAEFIPLSEETGLILNLGERVLQSAINECVRLTRAGFTGLRVAVNLSAHQLQQQELIRSIQRMLTAVGARGDQLQIEITESVLMSNVDNTATTLNALSDMGIEISLDDFGTGYSSLSYLKRFPIDVLKIDRSFVRDIPTDPDDSAIASAIISMAHNLGIQVVAEGVENEEQLQFLHDHDCDTVQGYYLSRPKPAEEVARYLNTKRPFPWP